MVSDIVLSHYEQGSLWEELKAQCKALPYRITYTTQIPRNFGYVVRFADVAPQAIPHSAIQNISVFVCVAQTLYHYMGSTYTNTDRENSTIRQDTLCFYEP